MLSYGLGVDQNQSESFSWYRLAAQQGNREAQFSLATCFHNGEGVPVSYEDAAKWLLLSAAQQSAPAQLNLGAMFHTGEGLPQNLRLAMAWFLISAQHGNADAQFYFATLMVENPSLIQLASGPLMSYAYMWLEVAAAQGLKKAIAAQQVLSGQMTARQIATAKILAAAWQPQKDIVPDQFEQSILWKTSQYLDGN